MSKSLSPFDYIKDISEQHPDHLIKDATDPRHEEKNYPAFIINRGLSLHADTLFYAQEMNLNAHLDGLLQYDYLKGSIRKRKRWSKWPKSQKDEDRDLIQQVYRCSSQKAATILQLLDKEQIEELRKQQNDIGGV